MNPLVSVIIPVYNTAKYIDRCLLSILNQTWKNLEILVIDDCSTDKSPLIIQEYCKRYSNVYYIRLLKKKGVGGARNQGIKLSKGHYIGFIDSDDWIDLCFIERMVSELKNNNADIAISGVLTEYSNPKDVVIRYEYEFSNHICQEIAFKLLTRTENQDSFISPISCNKVYKASFLKNNNILFKENNYNEDDYFNFVAFYFAKSVVLVPRIYYHYFQRSGSITNTLSQKHINDFIDCFSSLKLFLIKQQKFSILKEDYLSYFEKCLLFLLDMIERSNDTNTIKEKYIFLLFIKCQSIIPNFEYLQYIGLRRVKRFFDYRIK